MESRCALSDIDPSKLLLKEGCDVLLKWVKSQQSFIGSTEKKKCKSNLRGASYATSKVSVSVDRIESWDQGFDQNDKQVWGAVKSGYIFQRNQ